MMYTCTKWIGSAINIRNGKDPDDVMLLTQKSVHFHCKLALANQSNSDSSINNLSVKTAHYYNRL